MKTLYIITSNLTIGAAIAAAISFIVYIARRIAHAGAKTPRTLAFCFFVAAVILWVVNFIAWKRGGADYLNDRTPEEATQQMTGKLETAGAAGISEDQEPTQETAQQIEPAETTPEEPPRAWATLLAVQEHPVMNGPKTERIGTWASASSTKEYFEAIPAEDFRNYLIGIDAEGYNWFNVFFEDGTGIYYLTGTGGLLYERGAVDQEEGGAVIWDGTEQYFQYQDGAYIDVTEK